MKYVLVLWIQASPEMKDSLLYSKVYSSKSR